MFLLPSQKAVLYAMDVCQMVMPLYSLLSSFTIEYIYKKKNIKKKLSSFFPSFAVLWIYFYLIVYYFLF